MPHARRRRSIPFTGLLIALAPAFVVGVVGLGFIGYQYTRVLRLFTPTSTFQSNARHVAIIAAATEAAATHSLTPAPTLTPDQIPTDIPSPTPSNTDTVTLITPPSETPTLIPPPTEAKRAGPTLEDFWNGAAGWQLDQMNVGLPMGESDTIIGTDGLLWSYLHASYASAGIYDQWDAPVEFPGCVTLWKSADGGRTFYLTQPRCLIQCRAWPCSAQVDQIDQQQYPRVVQDDQGLYHMVYEWRGNVFARQSPDGLTWAAPVQIPGSGVWTKRARACAPYSEIGVHPFVDGSFFYECLVGGPPGIFVEGEQLYVFMGWGQNPGKMGCYVGEVASGYSRLRTCQANPLFVGAANYGPLDQQGAAANPYFDFRTISAADVLRVGDHYYMTYEGVRGPGPGDRGDTQFGLGLARSIESRIDGPWEKYTGNPILFDLPGNVGLGHADLVVIDGNTYLYTATSSATRGRFVLSWR